MQIKAFFPNYGNKFVVSVVDLSMKCKQDISLQHGNLKVQ